MKFGPSFRHWVLALFLTLTLSTRSGLWTLVLLPWAQVLALQTCPAPHLRELHSICFHHVLIGRGIQTWNPALRLGPCYKQHIFLMVAMISQFLSVPGFPKSVFQLPAYNTRSLHWTSLMLAAVLAAAWSTPSTYCLLAANSSHQGGLCPIPWMYLLLPVHLTPITVNPSTLNYNRYLLVWKLMWYWNFILVYIFLCVESLGSVPKSAQRAFLSPWKKQMNTWQYFVSMTRPQGNYFHCKYALFKLNFAFKHTNIFQS